MKHISLYVQLLYLKKLNWLYFHLTEYYSSCKFYKIRNNVDRREHLKFNMLKNYSFTWSLLCNVLRCKICCRQIIAWSLDRQAEDNETCACTIHVILTLELLLLIVICEVIAGQKVMPHVRYSLEQRLLIYNTYTRKR